MSAVARHRIGVVAYDRAPSFELSIPGEIFGSPAVSDRYQLLTIAGARGPIRTATGWRVATDGGLELLKRVDTVIVAGWRDELDPPGGPLRASLAGAASRGARMVSLCIGAFALAAAGILDGRRATTHWRHAPELARRHPAVEVDASVLYCDEGDVLTSAGTVAGIDLCLHIVRRDLGAGSASAVARQLIYGPARTGSQSQYVEVPRRQTSLEGDGGLLAWVFERLHEPLPIRRIAAEWHMSVRHVDRRFRALTGTTPLRWMLAQRVASAQRLLEETEVSVEGVAQACGFGSAAALRVHFTRAVGTSPNHYRQAFRQRPD